MIGKILNFSQPIFAVLFGLFVGLGVSAIAGENPFHVLEVLFKSAFGSPYDVGMTLYYATPLLLTGLSVAVAFQAGLFNIGGEGQLAMGALAAAAVGILCPGLSSPLAPILASVAAFIGGAFWGFIPGWLKARRGSHEVINTIMLNFIAAGVTSWVVLRYLPNPESQNPETAQVGSAYLIPQFAFFNGAPVSVALPLALGVAFLVWIFLYKTVKGFELRATGQNETAAFRAGIKPASVQIFALTLAGGLSGLIGVSEVLGNSGRFVLNFSPGYGFIGIAVALLGRNRPLGVVAAAVLFGALHKGSADLDFETKHVTRDLSMILQALVILSVSADGLWDWMKRSSKS